MMTKKQYVHIYITGLIVSGILDALWLMVIAPSLYSAHIGHLLSGTVNWIVAISFYLIFIIGIMIFALIPALEKRNIKHALIYGALFGFFCYMSYDLTNWATLKDWPALISFIDMAWGTFLAGATSLITYVLATAFLLPRRIV